MSSRDGAAYKSSSPETNEVWDAWEEQVREVTLRRRAFSDHYGRNLLHVRSAWDAGASSIVGLEAFENEVPGETYGFDHELRLPKRGAGSGYPRYLVPNTRRKSGKEIEQQLRDLTVEGIRLPGMPGSMSIGLHMTTPAMFRLKRTVWAFWPVEPEYEETTHVSDRVDMGLWVQEPLSRFYKAQETYDAQKEEA